MVRAGRIISQELRQRGSSGLVHGGSHRGLDSFHVEPAFIAALPENNLKKPVYFTRDFLSDRFRRFFSWGDGGVSATGRSAQICSLTSNS